jgi:Rrf2 family nitric oxide-sensitive transcriptional repressor
MKHESATISEIADFYQISRNHLVKVVHRLSLLGFINSTRGKNGGLKLARPAKEIMVGDVVRKTEPNFYLVECFNEKENRCAITGFCQLKGILNKGFEAFMKELDQYNLIDASKSTMTALIEANRS